MKTPPARNLLLLGVVMLAFVIAVIYLMGESCTVETAMSPVISPDKSVAIDLYSKKCNPRWSSDRTKEKEYRVVVLRPITDPPPEANRYKKADVVFEVEMGPEPMQLSFGAPGSFAFFDKLPEDEKKNTILIGCYLACPAAGIRKQVHGWRGQPIHYFLTETPSSPAITQ